MKKELKEFLNFLKKYNIKKLSHIDYELKKTGNSLGISFVDLTFTQAVRIIFHALEYLNYFSYSALKEEREKEYREKIVEYKEKFEKLLKEEKEENTKKVYELILKNI